jgi:hypothetical protein
MKYSVLCGLVAVLASGCTKDWQRAQTAASRSMACPKEQVYVEEGDDHFFAEGCGKHVMCNSNGATCRAYLTPAEQMAAARKIFARETQCPEIDIKVLQSAEGSFVDGCGRYAMCPDGGDTCLARNRPTCKELAQVRYDSCVVSARQEGKDGRNVWGSKALILSSSITSSIAENRGMDACKSEYTEESSHCDGAASTDAAKK